MDRFWAKVDKSGDCWMWTASKHQKGYGQVRIEGKLYRAHRLSYEWTYGSFDKKLCVCHKCDNPSCVKPEHLFLGTVTDNMRDMCVKGRHVSNKNWWKTKEGREYLEKRKSTREAVREDVHG